MKKLGYILVAAGAIIMIFVLLMFFEKNQERISPVPDDKGIKVIFISPGR